MAENKQKPYFEQWRQNFILWYLNYKFGSVAYCWHPNKLTELHLQKFKLEILQKFGYPVGPQNPDIQMLTFLTWDFFFFLLLFFSEKNQNL